MPSSRVAVVAVGLVAGCPGSEAPECRETAFDEAAMRAEVAYLASPDLDGRVPGTAGDEAVRAVVAARFECQGLTPIDESGAYEQLFTDAEDRATANILGVLPGTDADIAQALTESEPPLRTVVFAAFGSEESGYEGSEYFYTDPPSAIDPSAIVYNLNMDMIGSYAASGVVYALGALDGTLGLEVVERVSEDYPELDVDVGWPSDLSDNATFCERGIPYVFFWTEDEACYHDACGVE